MEKDDEVKGNGNSLDFGARIYDPRVGRWLSRDTLEGKYPELSPYHFSANNPVLLVDRDGRDFGISIIKDAHGNSTIIITANIYTISESSYNQVLEAVGQWNSVVKTVDVDDQNYTLRFDVRVIGPSKNSNQIAAQYSEVVKKCDQEGNIKKFYNALLIQRKAEVNLPLAEQSAKSDPKGNTFQGNWMRSRTDESKIVRAIIPGSYKNAIQSLTGGQTLDKKFSHMKIWRYVDCQVKNWTDSEDPIAHEIAHLFGLDDSKGFYYTDSGILKYTGAAMQDISSGDVSLILQLVTDYVKTGQVGSKVKIDMDNNTKEEVKKWDKNKITVSDPE